MPAERICGMPGHVNLIPLNDVVESEFKPSRRVAAFQKRLESHGLTATVRRSLGGDIDASCGQLRRKEMEAKGDIKPGVIYVLKNRNNAVNIDKKNLLHPFYMVYLSDDGEVICDHLHPKKLLDTLRLLCKDKKEYDRNLCALLSKETSDGRHMEHYSDLLQKAIDSMVRIKEESDIDSLFSLGETTALTNEIKGLDDFELITFLVIR